jgi:hypothetical protein
MNNGDRNEWGPLSHANLARLEADTTTRLIRAIDTNVVAMQSLGRELATVAITGSLEASESCRQELASIGATLQVIAQELAQIRQTYQ